MDILALASSPSFANNYLSDAFYLISLIVLIYGARLVVKSRIPAQTIKNLEDSNKSYETLDKTRQSDIKNLNDKLDQALKIHAEEKLEWTGAIKKLEGQLQVYREIPLREIAEGIQKIVTVSQENADSNKAILEQLKSTADIAAEDRDVLINSNKHIRTEVHKIIDEQPDLGDNK